MRFLLHLAHAERKGRTARGTAAGDRCEADLTGRESAEGGREGQMSSRRARELEIVRLDPSSQTDGLETRHSG